MDMTIDYRGFKITHPNPQTYSVYKGGSFIVAQPSLEFAKKWIDKYWKTT